MIHYIIGQYGSNGLHEVHNAAVHCNNPAHPGLRNFFDLGWHENARSAVNRAKSVYPFWTIQACSYCAGPA